jgi:translocation and assembly module TamB
VENAVSNAIGATDFNILPNLETVYRVNSQSFIRFSYDYNLNEFTVRYQTQF